MKQQFRYRTFIRLRNAVLAALLAALLVGCAAVAPGAGAFTPAAVEPGVPLFGEFKAKDTLGNEVTNDLFADYTLTMVNIWATTCSPCVNEMPELVELNAEYGEKGFQIVGIVIDVTDAKGRLDEKMLADALSIIESTGANYTHIIPTAAMFGAYLKKVTAVPTTVFLNSKGEPVGKAILGAADKADWAEIIEEKLG